MNLTLTGVSNAIKKYGPYVVLGILSFFILYYSIKIGIIIYKAQKEPEVIYNPIFGVIKKPTIKNSSNSAGLKFSIDTIEGKPVTTTASANIYFIPIPETKFGYRNRLFFMAQNFGIIDPISKYKLIDKNAEFTDEFQKLEIDIRNLNFSYEYFYQNEPELFDDTVIPTNEEAEKEAIEFLNTIDKYPIEFKDAKIQVKFYFFNKEKKTITQVKRNLDANIVKVYFTRPEVDSTTFVSKDYPDSHNFVSMIPLRGEYKIISAQIKYFDRSTEHFGIYPIKAADEAYKELKKGKGIVTKNLSDLKKITIKKLFIAYFDPDDYEEYFQPVYVFQGNGDFAAFVPAITNEYLSD